MQYGEQKEDEFFQKMLTRPRLFFSDSDLENIRNKTIAIVGIGGVGCIIIELLARWGIKSFRLMDGDKYEISNMNRQIFDT